jgi:hypothetical protein
VKLVSDLKGAGYLTSTGSVALLAAVSWKSASQNPWLMACLVAGVLLSIAGMMLRWRSHRLDQAEQEQKERAGDAMGVAGASPNSASPALRPRSARPRSAGSG